jgi:hypothetical protein
MGRHMGEETGWFLMNARMLDVLTGVASLAVFILALMAFPRFMHGQEGMAYVLAIAVYIALMSGAGVLIREKIA